MMKKILQLLSVMLMIFTVSFSAMANQEVNLEQPVMEVPAEIAGFTYAEGWWDVAPTPTSYVSIDTPGFTGYSDATLTLNTQITTDYNVYSSYSYSQCMWNQGMRLLDMSIEELIAQSGGWSSGWTTFGQYNFGPGWGGSSYELMADLSVDSCPMPMPEIAPEPIIINVGYFGASTLRYDYDHTDPFGKVWFVHYGNHCSGNCTNCPTTCGNASFVEEYMPVTCIGHTCNIGSRVIIAVPYGPVGCLKAGLGINHASIPQCIDIGYN